ncbi:MULTISPECIES: RimK family alpha-L-glutamate ligase [unclassified Bartonella]|uniref:ATP-grasp domain-containing protein n=1 Tax=unclassified Bartonella TaxID=2645622 RepID=UPI0035D04E06
MHSYMIAIIYDEMHPLLERVHATLIRKNFNTEFIHWSEIRILAAPNEVTSNLDEFDAIFMDRLAEFRCSYHSQFIQLANLPSVNNAIINQPLSYQLARDKALTAIYLAKLDFPIPETHIFQSLNQFNKFLLNKDIALVAKSTLGFCSNEVQIFAAKNPPLDEIKKWLKRDGQFIIQSFIENPGRFIWRCDIVSGEVKVCNKRYAFNSGGLYPICNGTHGGHIEILPPEKFDNLATSLALDAVKALGLDIAGVDIIEGAGENFYLIEVNPEPDILMDRFEFPDAIAELLINKARKVA